MNCIITASHNEARHLWVSTNMLVALLGSNDNFKEIHQVATDAKIYRIQKLELWPNDARRCNGRGTCTWRTLHRYLGNPSCRYRYFSERLNFFHTNVFTIFHDNRSHRWSNCGCQTDWIVFVQINTVVR